MWRGHSPLESLGEGVHVAVLYADERERNAHLIPYIVAASLAGKESICVAADEPDDLSSLLENRSPGSSAALVVLPTDETYLRDGRFASDEMAAWLGDMAQDAPLGTTHPATRVAGDIDWLDRFAGDSLAELHAYESRLDGFASSCRHTFACFYSRATLPAAGIIDVFKTHSKVLVGGVLWDSPFYEGASAARSGHE